MADDITTNPISKWFTEIPHWWNKTIDPWLSVIGEKGSYSPRGGISLGASGVKTMATGVNVSITGVNISWAVANLTWANLQQSFVGLENATKAAKNTSNLATATADLVYNKNNVIVQDKAALRTAMDALHMDT